MTKRTAEETIEMMGGDQPNVCPLDGARTEQLEQRDDFTVERCLSCGKRFNFWQDVEAAS